MALRFGANVDLVEAACLAHDIGHPPFGHAGEDELKQLMEGNGGFEANAQNLRILTLLESKSVDYPGLNLSRAAIDGQLKYKDLFSDNQKKFVYEDDRKLISWAGEEASRHFKGTKKWVCSFECEIMNLADDIAFSVHDLEDSIHAGYINADTFRGHRREIDEVIDQVEEKFIGEESNIYKVYEALVEIIASYINPSIRKYAEFPHRGRKSSRKELTSFLIGRYINAPSRKTLNVLRQDIVSNRYRYTVDMPKQYLIELEILRKLVFELVIRSAPVVTLEEKARYIIKKLFEKFSSTKGYYLLPDDWKELANQEGRNNARERVACDYISGMTDEYALKTYSRLFLPGQGSIFDI